MTATTGVRVVLRRDWLGRRRRRRLREWAFWWMLLFEHGQGWLRWGCGEAEEWDYVEDAHSSYLAATYTTAPPLRRLGIYLWQWVVLPRTRWRLRGEGLSWEEFAPYWPEYMTDSDRAGRLWPRYG